MSKRKAPSKDGNANSDFCDFLQELAEYEKNVAGNIYKYNAYRKAASSLASHPVRVQSGKEAMKLDGVGKKIADKLDEFIQTGELQKLKKIRNDDTSNAINSLTRVSGIGPSKAKDLVEEGITTIEELRNHQDKLNHHQIIGLRYLEDFEEKIPREEIERIESVIRSEIGSLDDQFDITICGSYRRGKKESGDIDTLISHPSFTSDKKPHKLLESVVNKLKECGLIVETISLGDVKFMGACKLAEKTRRLDIRLTPFDQYFCAILYFTGSDLFNKEMRAHALNNGYTLNEYCIRRIGSTGTPGEPLPVSCEEDIFDYIDYPYKKPDERNLKFKRDIDVIRENHKFLWLNEEPSSWEEQLAKKYYDRLYKEYCICDLGRYEEGEIALRWQIEAELVSGKGQFICGNKKCSENEGLKTWEVNFGYIEQGEKKNALVKLRLCSSCSEKLNYKHKRKEIKRAKKRKHRTKEVKLDEEESELQKKVKEEPAKVDDAAKESEDDDAKKEPGEKDEENNIWKIANPIIQEKAREDDFEEFIEQLLL